MSTPESTVVHLMRHGEVHNPDGILYGRLPGFRLSELGRAMATEVAQHLAAHDIVHVVSSPLERALETARPTADSHGLGIHVDGRLIEAGNFFEGKVVGVGDGVLKHPEYWSKLRDPFTPVGARRMPRSPPGWSLRSPTPGTRLVGTKRCSSATSFPCGRLAPAWKGAGCGTTPANASAPSPR